MAATYAMYHGPEGLKAIADRVHGLAATFAHGLKKLGTVKVQELPFFDTVKVTCSDVKAILEEAYRNEMNLRLVDANTVCVSVYFLFNWRRGVSSFEMYVRFFLEVDTGLNVVF